MKDMDDCETLEEHSELAEQLYEETEREYKTREEEELLKSLSERQTEQEYEDEIAQNYILERQELEDFENTEINESEYWERL
jgi:hypothetical protein